MASGCKLKGVDAQPFQFKDRGERSCLIIILPAQQFKPSTELIGKAQSVGFAQM
jgi:hypothetical protein